MHYKLKASSLVLSVVISLILAILVSSVILLGYHNRRTFQLHHAETRVQRNLQSAISLILGDTLETATGNENLDLSGSGRDSVRIRRGWWGLYQVATAEARTGRWIKKKSFLYGISLPPSMDGCLYMADHQRPLSISGATKLRGDAWISPMGLKTAYVDGRGFEYTTLLEGEVRNSSNQLPRLEAARSYLEELLRAGAPAQPVAELGDSFSRSFDDDPLVVGSKSPVMLKAIRMEGQVIIRSDSLIEVGAEAQLKDVLLVAPYVIIRKGFRGSVQIVASRQISIGDDCRFDYPSSAVLLQPMLGGQGEIKVGKNCLFSGTILSLTREDDTRKTRVSLDAGTEVEGVVYVSGYLSLAHSVKGIVLTDFFVYQTPSTLYENYLVNASIDRKALSGFFAVSPFFGPGSVRKLVQWVD